MADGKVDAIEKGQCKWEIAGGSRGQAVVFTYPNSRTGFNARTPGALHVAKAPDLLFTVQYLAGTDRFGQPISDEELNRLRQLAARFMEHP